jgi:hypothetical protein
MILDPVIHSEQLAAKLALLFQQERFEAQIVAPQGSREPGWSAADNYYIELIHNLNNNRDKYCYFLSTESATFCHKYRIYDQFYKLVLFGKITVIRYFKGKTPITQKTRPAGHLGTLFATRT